MTAKQLEEKSIIFCGNIDKHLKVIKRCISRLPDNMVNYNLEPVLRKSTKVFELVK